MQTQINIFFIIKIILEKMFSMYKSQKNIQNKGLDYKALYLQQRKLKQQFQRRAQIAQLKYRKLAQSMNKKCVRCMSMEQNKTKEDRILQLKQFKNGLNLLNMGSMVQLPKSQKVGKSRVIQNFGVFGVPESMLIQPLDINDLVQGQLLYVANMPTMTQQHAAKLSFPSGIIPKFYTGLQAKQKAIEIMSSSCSYAKTFIMSFQSKFDQVQMDCQVRKIMNPQNRIYAFCLTIQDFSLVPNWNSSLVQSEKAINSDKSNPTSLKALSCQQTDISFHNQSDCSIATSPRVYCIFSYYPFFYFYHQMLKAIVTSVKTQRLVIYRQSGNSLAEADSRFFLERVKQTYKQISGQIENWQVKLTKQYQLKLLNCQKIPLVLNPQCCMLNFLQDWGLSIFKMFNVDNFLDVFTLVMLEERIVFVSENVTLLTLAVHLFSQLLIRPFKYPYPVINILPEDQGYFQAVCPFIYGVLNSKKLILANNTIERFPENVFIFLQKQGVEIMSHQSKKNILKKRSKILHDNLTTKFKPQADRGRRVSNLQFTGQQINFRKDKLGVCTQITKQINLYLSENLMRNLPKNFQIEELTQKTKKNLKQNEDLNQEVFKIIKKQFQSKSKDEFLKAMLDTQIVNTHLFK